MRSVFDADHLGAQAELRGKRAQAAGQHKVGFERLANLLGCESAVDQRKDGIPGQHGEDGRARIGEPDDGLFGDGRSQMLGNKLQRAEGQDGQPRKRFDGAGFRRMTSAVKRYPRL